RFEALLRRGDGEHGVLRGRRRWARQQAESNSGGNQQSTVCETHARSSQMKLKMIFNIPQACRFVKGRDRLSLSARAPSVVGNPRQVWLKVLLCWPSKRAPGRARVNHKVSLRSASGR